MILVLALALLSTISFADGKGRKKFVATIKLSSPKPFTCGGLSKLFGNALLKKLKFADDKKDVSIGCTSGRRRSLEENTVQFSIEYVGTDGEIASLNSHLSDPDFASKIHEILVQDNPELAGITISQPSNVQELYIPWCVVVGRSPGSSLRVHHDILSTNGCQSLCQVNSECQAFVWHDHSANPPNQCWLLNRNYEERFQWNGSSYLANKDAYKCPDWWTSSPTTAAPTMPTTAVPVSSAPVTAMPTQYCEYIIVGGGTSSRASFFDGRYRRAGPNTGKYTSVDDESRVFQYMNEQHDFKFWIFFTQNNNFPFSLLGSNPTHYMWPAETPHPESVPTKPMTWYYIPQDTAGTGYNVVDLRIACD